MENEVIPLEQRKKALLEILADLETMTVPQRAYVMACGIGMFIGAAQESRGISREHAELHIYTELQKAADQARITFPVN